MVAKFRNGGQSCIAAKRGLVEESLVDEFLVKAAGRGKGLRVGAGHEPGGAGGPIIDQAGGEQVLGGVDAALLDGRLVNPLRPREWLRGRADAAVAATAGDGADRRTA